MFGEAPRSFKIALLVLFIVALGVLVIVILKQYGILGSAGAPSQYVPSVTTDKNMPQKTPQDTSAAALPQAGSPIPTTAPLSAEDIQKRAEQLGDAQANGTISPEEFQKQMNAAVAGQPFPTLPANTKK